MTPRKQRIAQAAADQPAAQHHHAARGIVALFARALRSGSLASVLSTAAVSVCSRRRCGSASAGTNATSQWVWYPEARHVRGPSARYTLVGYAVHHASSLFWAVGYEALQPHRARAGGRFARAAGIAALAYVVDYHLVPRRLSPGFEDRVGAFGLCAAYAAFAAGLYAATRPARGATGSSAALTATPPRPRPRHPAGTATAARSPVR